MIFEDANNAAEYLAPIFKEMRWVWLDSGVPTELDIFNWFQGYKERMPEKSVSSVMSGRLVVYKIHDTGKILYALESDSFIKWLDKRAYENDDKICAD